MKATDRSPSASSSSISKKTALLHAFLSHVPFDGWSEKAYEGARSSLALTSRDASRLFPQGIDDLAAFFGQTVDDAMTFRIRHERGFVRWRTRDKIAFAARVRFEHMFPFREAVRRLLYWYARPTHVAEGLKRLAQTADIIWRAAGDNSTDFNFYSKRVLLAAVIKATTLFWLDDPSTDGDATTRFLERRLAEVLKLGKSFSLLSEFHPSEIVSMVRRKVAGR